MEGEMMDNDQWMIAQIKRRNEAGLKQLIDKYTGLLKSIIQKTMAYLPQYQEECLNDVLLAIWNNIEQYDAAKSSFKNWICVIAKYRAINYLKKYQNEIQNLSWEEEKHEESYAHHDNVFQQELWEIQLDQLLEPLSEQDKILFKDYFISTDDTETVAKRNELTPGALYSRISRGKKKIRDFFAREGGEAHDKGR